MAETYQELLKKAQSLGVKAPTTEQIQEASTLITSPGNLTQPTSGLGSTQLTNQYLQEASQQTGIQAPQFTPQEGSGTYVEDIANNIDQNNQTQPQTTISGTSDATRTEERNKEIERIKSELEAGAEKPSQYNSLEEYDKLRQEQGIVKDEEELNALQNEMRLIQQELRQFSATAGEGTSEAGRIGLMSEAERNANFRLEGLAIRERAIIDRLNSKNNYINTRLKLGESDYDRAYQEYTDEYNKNLKAISLYNEELDDRQKDALTAFTTTYNLLKDSNISEIDPAIQTQMDAYSLQLGIPVGTFSAALSSEQQDKILNIYSRDEGIFAVMEGSDGSPYVTQLSSSVSGGGTTGGISGATTSTTLERILGGVGSIDDLTPSQQQKVQDEAFSMGLYDESPPDWFRQNIEQELQMNLEPNYLKQLWDEYRGQLTTSPETSSTGDDDYDKY